jgi:serine phosphatase RsbU (regulator of sigma subunit)
MLKSLRVSQLVAINLGIVLCLSLLIGLAGLTAYYISKNQNEVILQRNQVDRLTLQLQMLTIERSDIFHRYLETGDTRLALLDQSKHSAYLSVYNELAILSKSSSEAVALDQLDAAEKDFNALVQQAFSLSQNNQAGAARDLWNEQGEDLQRKVITLTNRWNQIQTGNNQSIIEQARQTERLAVISTTVFIGFVLLGGTLASVIITRSITRPIAQLVAGTHQIGGNLNTRVLQQGPQEIAFLGETINLMAGRLLEAQSELQHHKDRLERELIAASRTQANFLPAPPAPQPTLEVAFGWQPARELAGDFYTWVELEPGLLAITLCDVVGKGAAAAMAGSLMLGLLETQIPKYRSPAQLLQELNAYLCQRFPHDKTVTACCHLIIHAASGEVTVSNGGCLYPYHTKGAFIREVEISGLPLGLWPDFTYSDVKFQLEPGDRLILHSDGLVEAYNSNNQMFGFERLRAALAGIPKQVSAQSVVNTLLTKLGAFLDKTDFSDDVTLIVIRRPFEKDL